MPKGIPKSGINKGRFKSGKEHIYYGKKRPEQSKFMKEHNPMNNVESRKKIGIKNKGIKKPWLTLSNIINNPSKNPIIAKKMSDTIKKNKSHAGKRNGNYGKGCHFSPKRVYYKNICFRSTWEVTVAKWLDKNNYTWKYEPKRFYFKNKDYTYLPDFYVKELDSYIEVKGWYSDICKKKINSFKEEYSNLKLMIIDSNTIEEYKFL